MRSSSPAVYAPGFSYNAVMFFKKYALRTALSFYSGVIAILL